ncbi:nuclear transport factor 2 family protein [Variovorax rhizosphaerae]|uniref:nuclear transport factor 2 family protein n=1 Tax=Variovorax rhizosphaerae TaxID=1836200 RepID=UPI003BF4E634
MHARGGACSPDLPEEPALGADRTLSSRNGSLKQELVQSYAWSDMVVLATIERAHIAVGGLPAQVWSPRVTLVYRREGSGWRLAHRHADPLGNGISLQQAAALAQDPEGCAARAAWGFRFKACAERRPSRRAGRRRPSHPHPSAAAGIPATPG